MRQIKINSTTGSEIVTTSEFKTYAKIDTDADDTLIGNILVQSRIWCENFISRDIVAKNRTYWMDETNGIFDLPFGPVASISSITINGSATTDYEITGLDNETIELDGGLSEKVKVVYITTGMDDNLLQQAVLQFATSLYENRVDYIENGVKEIPTNVKQILASYKSMFV